MYCAIEIVERGSENSKPFEFKTLLLKSSVSNIEKGEHDRLIGYLKAQSFAMVEVQIKMKGYSH